jgi:uncharacterized protein YgbK (DUF1537 family)
LYTALIFKDTLADDTLFRQWADGVLEALSTSDRVIIAILQPVVHDSELAQNLRITIATVVQRVVSSAKIHELFIEGGATAEAVLRTPQWETLDVLAEYGP